jgi:hypothetical protein
MNTIEHKFDGTPEEEKELLGILEELSNGPYTVECTIIKEENGDIVKEYPDGRIEMWIPAKRHTG